MRHRSVIRSGHLTLIAILVLAAGVRCVYLVSDPYPFEQSGGQGELARNILRGHWFVENAQAMTLINTLRLREHRQIDPAAAKWAAVDAHPHYQTVISEVVGPGVLLAGVWALTGSERFIYGGILQVLIDLGVLLLVYRIAMQLFARRRAALIAAGLYAVFLPIARQASIVDPDFWGIEFTVAIIALYLQAMGSPNRRWWWLLACGLTVGLGAYFRANVLLLPIALTLASLRWSRMSRPLSSGLAIMAIAALPILPWTIKNYSEYHRIIPIRIGVGSNLWEGLGEIPNDFGAVEDDNVTYEQVHRMRPDLANLSPAYDEYLRSRAVHAIEQHPLFYAEIVGRRILFSTLVVYESAWMYKGGESPLRYRARTGKGLLSYVVNRPLDVLQDLIEPAMFVFAMLALAFTWRGRRREHLLLIAALLSAVIPYWILHLEPRYVLPTAPIYLMWIGLGADLLGERTVSRLRARRSWREAIA